MGENEKTRKIDARQSYSTPKQPLNAAILRVLDASINRASEGLRVVESFARMVLEDGFLSAQLKQLRHDLAESCGPIDAQCRLQSRDSESDVGRDVKTESEYQRSDFESLIRSNMARVQQATRTIEEFSKLNFGSVATDVEQIRYRAYTLEKAIFNTAINRSRFEESHLYVLIDACGQRSGFEQLSSLVGDLVAAGVDLIQLRDKSLTDRELVAAGKLIASLTQETKTLWVMNDRADLCVAANADGVHFGQDELSVHDARMILRPNQFIGVSTHSIEQARQAVIDGADYIGVGPVFESQTKSFDSHVGVELVSSVVSEISLPAFAIGGIDSNNVEQVTAVGCQRIAVSSAVCKANEPGNAAINLMNRLSPE
ncbi:thiamine phosphate synthase [Mariniblastus fucicola]|uniref:Thiamine-phosphate synthase n=1 Tax=Mariniblastus fucicola TaxID=980251 RepID=A0A5B9PNG1_9BACT|nr:thiamine phosphate synthase [Mariniblastus fucicola]QEG24081.1 Thiamine-phosphate synthase [Mariniblastus fucicola]